MSFDFKKIISISALTLSIGGMIGSIFAPTLTQEILFMCSSGILIFSLVPLKKISLKQNMVIDSCYSSAYILRAVSGYAISSLLFGPVIGWYISYHLIASSIEGINFMEKTCVAFGISAVFSCFIGISMQFIVKNQDFLDKDFYITLGMYVVCSGLASLLSPMIIEAFYTEMVQEVKILAEVTLNLGIFMLFYLSMQDALDRKRKESVLEIESYDTWG